MYPAVPYLRLGESTIAAVLDRVALNMPHVAIGSYPVFDAELDYRVKVTIEAAELAPVEDAPGAHPIRLTCGCGGEGGVSHTSVYRRFLSQRLTLTFRNRLPNRYQVNAAPNSAAARAMPTMPSTGTFPYIHGFGANEMNVPTMKPHAHSPRKAMTATLRRFSFNLSN